MTQTRDENRLGYTIGKTNWYIKTLLNKLLRQEDCGVTNEQWLVLKVIENNPGVSQTQIAEKSQKDKTNITRILDLLEKSACIERCKDDHDRRMYRIHITEQGRQVLKTIDPITQKTEEICSRSLTPEKTRALIKSLNAVCEDIRKEL